MNVVDGPPLVIVSNRTPSIPGTLYEMVTLCPLPLTCGVKERGGPRSPDRAPWPRQGGTPFHVAPGHGTRDTLSPSCRDVVEPDRKGERDGEEGRGRREVGP